LTIVLLSGSAHLLGENGGQREYQVRVTNLTRGQRFTPVLVVSHNSSVRLFTLGSPASSQLKALAEEGNVAPLADLLRNHPGVCAVANSPLPPPATNLIAPGATVEINIPAGGRCDRISAAAMLIPTNDGFFAANSVEIPNNREAVVVKSPVYDSGTERNDELCSSIPGPGFTECITPSNPQGNGGGAAVGGGEGFVHINGGIHGVGNFNAALRDWRNPAARIAIQRKN
jgi:hypothetical protein